MVQLAKIIDTNGVNTRRKLNYYYIETLVISSSIRVLLLNREMSLNLITGLILNLV